MANTEQNAAEVIDTDTPVEDNYFNLSDEDFLNQADPAEDTPDIQAETAEEVTEDLEEVNTIATNAESEEEEEEIIVDDEEENSQNSSQLAEDSEVPVEETLEASDKDLNNEEEEEAEEDSNTSETTEYKAFYEQITAPFKANGTQLQAKTPEEVVTLMQMGANYHKKMAGLKPALKIVKMLEKHQLMNPEQLSYLIDLHEKKPEAIVKLLKDSNIDPVDIDVTSDSTYKPDNKEVTDNEVELDQVLDSIKDSPTYNRTLSVLSTVWDTPSKQTISSQPHIIPIINEHMANGVFDAINEAIVREKSFGRLTGMSDFDAYKYMGDILQSQGKLPGQQQPKSQPKVSPRKAKVSTQERKKQKNAVRPTGNTRKKTGLPTDFNPLSMSDEEFNKIVQQF